MFPGKGWKLSTLRAHLRSRMKLTLPGDAAHIKMAPRPRRGWTPGVLPTDARPSAALVYLFESNDGPHILLTKRSKELPSHPGQISLPGGTLQKAESTVSCALRETEEEVGLDRNTPDVLGKLTPLFVPVSGFAIYPIVAIGGKPERWQPDPREVEHVLEVPLEVLAGEACACVEEREFDGRSFTIPYYRFQGEQIWGATAMVLAEFADLLKTEDDESDDSLPCRR